MWRECGEGRRCGGGQGKWRGSIDGGSVVKEKGCKFD